MAAQDPDPLIGYREIAQLSGLTEATLRGYAARTPRTLPPPDEHAAADRPRWRTSTIDRWLRSRPGRGAPGRPRRRTSSARPTDAT